MMARKSAAPVIAKEYQRVLVEFGQVDSRVAELLAHRKELATVAQRMGQVLRSAAGAKGAERLIADLGLADLIAKLPGVPGRKPAAKAPRARPAAEATATKTPKSKVAKAQKRKAQATAAAPDVLPKGTRVRVLSGKFEGMVGVIGYTIIKGATVTYTFYLRGPDGRIARTQMNHGKLGQTWEVVADGKAAAAPAKPARKGKVVRRKAKTAKPATPKAAAEPPPTGIVPKGTAIKMLTGKFLGYTGKVTSVQVTKTGPKPDAIYMLGLIGPNGEKARTSVKQSSLGRVWTKVE
jgi:transcription antitermination factor NusG